MAERHNLKAEHPKLVGELTAAAEACPKRGRGDFVDFMGSLPSKAERSLAVMTDARGEVTDPAATSGLLQSLPAGCLDAPMLTPAEPH